MAKVKLPTGVKDIVINQGDDFRIQARLCTGSVSNRSPIDITGYTFQCKIRETADSDTVIAEAVCNIIDAPNGLVEAWFDDSVTGRIETDGEEYDDTTQLVWDLLATAPEGDTVRILNGKCYVSPGVSFSSHD